MANQIKMAERDAIVTLYGRGWSRRRIARELDLDRETVGRQIRLEKAGDSNPAIPPAGIQETSAVNSANVPAGMGEAEEAKPAIPPTGIGESIVVMTPVHCAPGPGQGHSGRLSTCAPLHETILRGVQSGLTAQRIYQDLVLETGFCGAYDAVKRYVRRFTTGHGPRVERMACAPGEEAQVDFGQGAPVTGTDGHRHKTWVFRAILSHSRKGYSESVYHQTTESFIRAIENAFRSFGGVTKTVVIDNLRAAVQRVDWYEPELTPKVAEFCRHYGTVILPTRPRRPEHKGKVERGVGYVKGNALKARSFGSLAEQNEYLRWWEEHVADRRLHGTTREQVGRAFEERERSALLPLPPMPFPCFQEGPRTVHRDSHVEVAKAYYEVPEEYIGRQVWVRWDERMVRVFNQRQEPIGVHVRLEPGRFSGSRGRNMAVEHTAEYWCKRARRLGAASGEWARRLHAERGIEAIRPLMGLQGMARRFGVQALERACELALLDNALRLRDLRSRLEPITRPKQLTFLEEHPLIRNLQEYGNLVNSW